MTEGMRLGPDAQKHIDGIMQFVDAGFDHVYVHQVGPKQDEFFRFYSKEVIPRFEKPKAQSNSVEGEARN
jgi:hypothetical protein